MVRKLVVLGANAASMSAASQAKRIDPSIEVTAIEQTNDTSYSSCGIPYLLGGIVAEADDLVARSADQHRARGISMKLGHTVESIDVRKRIVTARHESATETFHFDALMYGLGALPVRPPIDGIDAYGVFGVQTLIDATEIAQFIESEKPKRAAIVGGGYIGLEMAEAMSLKGIKTTLIEKLDCPMSTMDSDMASMISDALKGFGVELKLGVSVEGFISSGGKLRSVTTDHGEVPADVVFLGLGVRPNVELAREAGLEIGVSGGVATDARMETNESEIYAGGDCVETLHRVTGQAVTIALGTHANKQGRVAGTNIAGGSMRFEGVIGTAITKVCSLEVARTGLGEHEAADAGFEVECVIIDSSTRAGYYPDASPMRVKLIVESKTNRVLGGQITGGQGSGKRIDIVAQSVWHNQTAADLAFMDLSYAPPFSSVWDPVQVAARKVSGL